MENDHIYSSWEIGFTVSMLSQILLNNDNQ